MRAGGLILLLGRLLTVRHWREAWGSYALLIGIVAIGVGSFNGIRQASRAATANFGLFNEAVSGRSDFIVEGLAGDFSETVLLDLGPGAHHPDWHWLPVVEGTVTEVDAVAQPVRRLRLVGLDLASLGNLGAFIEGGFRFEEVGDGSWEDRIGSAPGVWIGAGPAEARGLQSGDRLRLVCAGRVREVPILGILEGGGDAYPDDLLLADLPVVQSLLERPGRLDRVEILVADRESRADARYLAGIEDRVQRLLPSGLRLLAAEERLESRSEMTAAFRLNLMVLSLIAMVVGAYLVLQALDAAVVRRRSEIGILKSLGIPNRVIFAGWLMEAGVVGLLGSCLGVLVGWGMAQGAVRLVAGTVDSLYFATSAAEASVTAGDWGTGLLLGMGFSLLAGWLPARDAVATPPAQVLSRGDWAPGLPVLRNPWIGWALVLSGVLTLGLGPIESEGGARIAIGGFLTAGFWIFGGAFLGGGFLVPIAGWVGKLHRSPVGRIAWSRLAEGGSRHRLAVAGLVVAVGMVTGMLQLVGSFRTTIHEWFDVRFGADLFLSERGGGSSLGSAGISPAVVEAIASDAAVEVSDTWYQERVRGPEGWTVLAGADFEVWAGRVSQIWLREPGTLEVTGASQRAYVSEAFARRFEVMKGGQVDLETAVGVKTIEVAGVYAEYGNEFGTAVVPTRVWMDWMGREHARTMSLFLRPGEVTNAVRDRLRLEYPGMEVRNQSELRTRALEIFDETFRVTSALNVIGLAVALVGLLLGLASIFRESRLTWWTLRLLGLRDGERSRAAGWEGAGIALVGWIAGTLLGLALGWLLVNVINVQSFGWTLVRVVPVAELLVFGFVLVVAGGLSGIAARWIGKDART